MFGAYRTILALWVAAFHLGDFPPLGAYAVFGFYILSGYLMTLIMHHNYGYTMSGISKYGINRFLRVFPIYWASITLSAILILLAGSKFSYSYHDSLFLPNTIKELLRNIFLFFPLREDPRLTPPAWALTVELVYYILIGFGLSRYRHLVLMWFILSVLYHAGVNILDLDWNYKYFYIPAASLPFSTGALIFHYRNHIRTTLSRLMPDLLYYMPVILLGLIAGNVVLGLYTGIERSGSFYINYILNVLIISTLVNCGKLPLISKSLDKRLGDLSYPIYLVHYQSGLITILFAGFIGINLQRPDIGLFIAALPVLIGLSYLFTRWIERPIEALRKHIKE